VGVMTHGRHGPRASCVHVFLRWLRRRYDAWALWPMSVLFTCLLRWVRGRYDAWALWPMNVLFTFFFMVDAWAL
jgi:hypothetical protein